MDMNFQISGPKCGPLFGNRSGAIALDLDSVKLDSPCATSPIQHASRRSDTVGLRKGITPTTDRDNQYMPRQSFDLIRSNHNDMGESVSRIS